MAYAWALQVWVLTQSHMTWAVGSTAPHDTSENHMRQGPVILGAHTEYHKARHLKAA